MSVLSKIVLPHWHASFGQDCFRLRSTVEWDDAIGERRKKRIVIDTSAPIANPRGRIDFFPAPAVQACKCNSSGTEDGRTQVHPILRLSPDRVWSVLLTVENRGVHLYTIEIQSRRANVTISLRTISANIWMSRSKLAEPANVQVLVNFDFVRGRLKGLIISPDATGVNWRMLSAADNPLLASSHLIKPLRVSI
jgi:hypothetical protein